MGRSSDKREEGQDWLMKFEQALAGGQAEYFDQEAYEYIIVHYLSENDAEKALTACRMALRQYPYSSDLLIDMGRAQLMSDEAQEALRTITEAEALAPHNPELLTVKAECLCRLSRHTEALALLEGHVWAFDEPEAYHFALGACHQSSGHYTLAIAAYKEALALNPGHEESLYELAFCLDLTGELADAVIYYQNLIDLDPYADHVWHNLGVIYNKLEQHEKAVECLELATAIREDYALAWYNLGNAYMNLERYEPAQMAFRTSSQLEPHQDSLVALGAACQQLEQYDQAVAQYKLALRLDPQCDEAWYGIGSCLIEQEKYFESIHFFSKAIEINPDSDEYWLGLATAEYETGNMVSALEAYEEAANINPENPAVWLDWSYLYYDMGDYSRAVALVLSGMDDLPNEADLYYRATAYLLEGGSHKEAATYLETALTLDFDRHVVLYEFFPQLEKHRALYKIIERYRTK